VELDGRSRLSGGHALGEKEPGLRHETSMHHVDALDTAPLQIADLDRNAEDAHHDPRGDHTVRHDARSSVDVL
jgi:hypothetical protein